MNENIIKEIINKVLKSMQLVLTLAYLMAIGIGMLFNNQKYDAFGINIFDYASIFDFLIAPFADFKIIAFTFLTILITYSLFKVDLYWQEKFLDITVRLVPVISEYLCHLFRSNRATIPFRMVPISGLICATENNS